MAAPLALLLAGGLFAAVAASAAEPVSYDGHRLIRVRPTTDDQTDFLRDLESRHHEYQLDFWTHASKIRPVDIRVPPSVYDTTVEMLTTRGLNVEVVQEDIQKLIDASRQGKLTNQIGKRWTSDVATRAVINPIVTSFPRHAQINAWLQSLAAAYPTVASLVNIGKTYEGRDMLVLKLTSGTNSALAPKKKIFIEAAIHAREWITVGSINYIIDQMAQNNGALLKQEPALAAMDWYFLPVANPDGYEYTHTGDRLWRKTRTRYAGTTCVGADPNRNWDFHWMESGSSTNPCDLTYAGPYSFSEKCVVNEKNFLSQLTGLTAFISLHSSGQMWFLPYAYAYGARPADYSDLRTVATQALAALYKVKGTQYSLGSPPELLYAAAGGTYDWVKGRLNVKYSYTLELPPVSGVQNGFIIDPSTIIPSGIELFEAVKVVASYAGRS